MAGYEHPSCKLEEIPNDVLFGICKYLNISTVGNMMRLNKNLHQKLKEPIFWLRMLLFDFGEIKPRYKNYVFWEEVYKTELESMRSSEDNLMWAIKNHHHNAVLRFIDSPCRIYDSASYVRICITTGTLDIFKTLVEWNRVSDGGSISYALIQTLSHGKLEMYKFLKKYKKIGCIDYSSDKDILREVVSKGHLRECKYLVKHGAPVNQGWIGVDTYDSWSSPLYIACQQGYYDIADFLIRSGGEIEHRYKGFTPLYVACSRGKLECVELLISHGANVNIVGGDGSTPLYVASQNGYHDIVELLLKNGARQNKSFLGIYPFYPLHIAAQLGFERIVELLLEYGADVNFVSPGYFTPLYLACHNGHDNVVRMLLDNGANYDFERLDECNPLRIAVGRNRVGVVRELCNKIHSLKIVDYLLSMASKECFEILEKYKKKI